MQELNLISSITRSGGSLLESGHQDNKATGHNLGDWLVEQSVSFAYSARRGWALF
jgi:hypothetical protein